MSKYQSATLKEIQNNPLLFKGQKVILEGVVRGLCYNPGNFIISTKFEGLLEQDGSSLGFSGADWFDRLYATRMLKASSETGLPVQLKGKLNGSAKQYELKVSGIYYQGIEYFFK